MEVAGSGEKTLHISWRPSFRRLVDHLHIITPPIQLAPYYSPLTDDPARCIITIQSSSRSSQVERSRIKGVGGYDRLQSIREDCRWDEWQSEQEY